METTAEIQNQVISANVEFYKKAADIYDQYESIASDPFFQEMIEKDLSIIDERLRDRFGPIRVLDCGGGSGNLTLKMLRRGWVATVVDVSSEMLVRSKAKVNAGGYQATFVNSSIEDFCQSYNEKYEVITFSSVLHHLYDPLGVVDAVASRVLPGGFFYSNFDPAIPESLLLASCFRNLDTIAAKVLRDRKDIMPGLVPRLRKITRARDAVLGRRIASPGDIAEYHAHEGVDDKAIIALLDSRGFHVDHSRYGNGRIGLTRGLNEWLQLFPGLRVLAERCDSARA